MYGIFKGISICLACVVDREVAKWIFLRAIVRRRRLWETEIPKAGLTASQSQSLVKLVGLNFWTHFGYNIALKT